MINIANNLQFEDFKKAQKSEQVRFFQYLNNSEIRDVRAADIKKLITKSDENTPRRSSSISIFKCDSSGDIQRSNLVSFVERFVEASRSRHLVTRMVAKKWLNFLHSLSDDDKVTLEVHCHKQKTCLIRALLKRDVQSCVAAFAELKSTPLAVSVTRANGEIVEQVFERDGGGNIKVPSFINKLGF